MTTFLTNLYRWALALQASVMLAQAMLAGLALSGASSALRLHIALGGGAAVLFAAAQVTSSAILWRDAVVPRWAALANIGFLAAIGVQMAAGQARIFALHLPLGLALFAAAAGLAGHAWRLAPQSSRTPPHRRALAQNS